MNRKIIPISIVVIVAVFAGFTFIDMMSNETSVLHSGTPLHELSAYEPSNISLANPDFIIVPSSVSMATTDISKVKQTILATFRGTVTNIGEPIDWLDNVEQLHGAIPVTIKVIQNSKDAENKKYQKGDLFTFYVDSSKMDGKYYIASYEPQFEIGEEVIVHISKADLGPMGVGGDNYFVELGEYGKYKIQDGKAYNEKFNQGRIIEKAIDETR